jgi:hypothetical protein
MSQYMECPAITKSARSSPSWHCSNMERLGQTQYGITRHCAALWAAQWKAMRREWRVTPALAR